MSLQIIARAKASAHLWHRFNLFRGGHDIWRVYRWWGFMTERVVCTCGLEFTKPKPGAQPLAELLVAINNRRPTHG